MGEYLYLDLLQKILQNGDFRKDRTGTGTYSLFGQHLRFDLRDGFFPLLTTKKVYLKAVIHELLWFLSGSTNISYLKDNKVTIWDEWADQDGNLGPVYGKQWRSWDCPDGRTIDQIQNVVNSLQNNPNSRRHIVTAWNPADIESAALPPCHCFFQFYVSGNELSCQLYQRSADVFLGLPFNIASYALLLQMMAQVCGYTVGDLFICIGDAHIYRNHVAQAKEQIQRNPRNMPVMQINRHVFDISKFRYEDFRLIGYDPHPAIKGDVSV